jgi:hypothetical protein
MNLLTEYDFAIGIIPGEFVGLATWDIRGQVFVGIETLLIHEAFEQVRQIPSERFVRLLDTRQVRFKTREERGSINRDVEIWTQFLQYYHIPYELVRPLKKVNWPPAGLPHIPGWKTPTSQHGRHAALLVCGWRNLPPIGGPKKI